jgi:hypothetical protein
MASSSENPFELLCFVSDQPKIATSSFSTPPSPSRVRLTANADLGEVMEQSKDIQEPHRDSDDHDCIQDRLDRPLHWYEAVNQPKKDAHHQNQ